MNNWCYVFSYFWIGFLLFNYAIGMTRFYLTNNKLLYLIYSELYNWTEIIMTIRLWGGFCYRKSTARIGQTEGSWMNGAVGTTSEVSVRLVLSIGCSSKANSIVKAPHPSFSQSLPAPTIRKMVTEHQSLLQQTAQQLFPPGCESPELNSHRPSLNPHTNPLPPETWTITPNPQPYHITEKTVKLFCAIGPIQTTCSNTLSSICTFTHYCVYIIIPQKTQ